MYTEGSPFQVLLRIGRKFVSPKLSLLFLVLPIVFLAAVACQLSTAGAPSQTLATPTPLAEEPRAQVASATPAPTQTPLPDRTDCNEVRGTQYRSGSEREWYLANCLPTPTPTPAVPAPNPPAIPGSEVQGERWILVDIKSQTTTAMIGNAPVYKALVTTGKDDWETPVGNWRVEYRVENETMTSSSIGAEEHYVLEDVLYTQYFTTAGHALHLNYWRDDYYFGNIRSSHGCIGMRLADAKFFWDFAKVGTRLTVQ
jgi:lipoprotein-anchoring transpeptidase ErfK/SrfK